MIQASIDGLSAEQIRLRLRLPISTRQVQRILRARRGPVEQKKSGRLPEDAFGAGAFRSIVFQLLVDRGLDPHLCGICGIKQLKVCDMHHTKYDGATIYDVIFACHACNVAREQKGLA